MSAEMSTGTRHETKADATTAVSPSDVALAETKEPAGAGTVAAVDEQKLLSADLQTRVNDLAKELEAMYGSNPDLGPSSCTMIIIQAMIIAKEWAGIKGPIKKQIVLEAFKRFVANHSQFTEKQRNDMIVFGMLFGAPAIDGMFWISDQEIKFKPQTCSCSCVVQ